MSQPPSYIAFISYRHLPLDMEAAKRVQKKIESYTIPKEFREQFGAKKFGHVFRDEDELPTSASLSDSIYSALDQSKYLIVICTPDLPQSKWCEAEIRYFLETHDRDHIIAVLADGDPEESFSPYLLHDFDSEGRVIADYEPLAANIDGPNHTINRKAFNKEVTRLFAAFLSCPFDALWQRERRARVNRLLTASAVVIAILCAFLGVVLNRNARISEQNKTIEGQNRELQSRLSTALVSGGMAKLEDHDVAGAIEDALTSLGSGDPAIYDHRVGKLLAGALCAYKKNEMRSSVVYSQSTGITEMKVTDDKKHMLLLDEVGVLRCLDLTTHEPLWEAQTGDARADRESSEIPAEIYSQNLGDRVIYRDSTGVFCRSVADGVLEWSYLNKEGDENGFQAISDDGSLFVVAEQDSERGTSEIVILDTANGTERGRIDLTQGGKYVPVLSKCVRTFDYAAAFSPDSTRFAYMIPVEVVEEEHADEEPADDESADEEAAEEESADEESANEEPADEEQLDEATDAEDPYGLAGLFDFAEPKNGYTICYADMNTMESRSVGLLETKFHTYLFYGMDVDATDDSIFLAAYTGSSIHTILCTANGEAFDFKEQQVTHKYKAKGGIDFDDDYFGITDCRYLSKNGRVYVFSDNQMLIYSRAENELYNFYPLTGSIVNAYWADPENYMMEVITSDGCITGYTMVYGGNIILGKVFARKFDQDIVSKSCPAGDATVSKRGSIYTASDSAPGRLYFVEYVSDPNGETLISGAAGRDFSYVLAGYSDTGLLFNNDYTVTSFDKRSGEIRGTTGVDEYLTGSGVIILDADHFLIGNNRYSMDGTVDSYARPTGNEYSELVPDRSISLSDGQIMSWGEYTIFGYDLDESQAGGKFGDGNPSGVNVWLNGEPVESFDPEDTVLFYDDIGNFSPETFVGENGLVLRCGHVIDLSGGGSGPAAEAAGDGDTEDLSEFESEFYMPLETFTVRSVKDLYILDALTGTVTALETPYPLTGDIKAALAHIEKLCAVAYDSGDVVIYDVGSGDASGDASGAAVLDDGRGGFATPDNGGGAAVPYVGSGSAIHLESKYIASEIMNICFSDDDAYLVVLTSSGRVDIFETGNYQRVFSERVEEIRAGMEMYSLYAMRAQPSKDRGILFLTVGSECMIIDTVGWSEIVRFDASSVTYDEETGKIYTIMYNYEKDTDGVPEIVAYPCYDIPALAEWAKKETGDGSLSPFSENSDNKGN